MKLKLMTFNIQHGRNHNLSGDVVDLDAVMENVISQNPDIVSLNEVRRGVDENHASGFSNQPSYFSERFGHECMFGKSINIYKSCEYGNAIMSKYKIVNFELIPIPDPTERTEGFYYETRSIIRTDYLIGDKKLTVLNSHFGLAPQEQTNAVDTVLSIVSDISHPVVIMGDFNMTPDYHNVQRLSEHFIDAHIFLGKDCATYPSHSPDERIDYIFVKGMKVISADTVKKIISDHFAITAEVEI